MSECILDQDERMLRLEQAFTALALKLVASGVVPEAFLKARAAVSTIIDEQGPMMGFLNKYLDVPVGPGYATMGEYCEVHARAKAQSRQFTGIQE